jgi:hypothetical protein
VKHRKPTMRLCKNLFSHKGIQPKLDGYATRRSDERASHDVRPEKAHHPAGKNAICAQLPGVRTIMVP